MLRVTHRSNVKHEQIDSMDFLRRKKIMKQSKRTLNFFEREVYSVTVILLIPFAQGFTKKLHVFKTV